jgi:hypothetical protein
VGGFLRGVHCGDLTSAICKRGNSFALLALSAILVLGCFGGIGFSKGGGGLGSSFDGRGAAWAEVTGRGFEDEWASHARGKPSVSFIHFPLMTVFPVGRVEDVLAASLTGSLGLLLGKWAGLACICRAGRGFCLIGERGTMLV